jgi:DNA-binding MarR family transcriptional regulator
MDPFPPDESLALLFRDMHRTFNRSFERRIGVYGITTTMWYYIRLLSDRTSMSQREISESLGIRGPTAIQVLNELEQKRLISRTRDLKDRRKVDIQLTPLGVDLKKRLLGYAMEVQDIALGGVSFDRQKIFREVLERMRAALTRDQES